MDERERVSWIIRVVNALNGHEYTWGCLSTKNKLFTIADFETVDVPFEIVKQLLDDGIISEHSADFNGNVFYEMCKKRVK